MKRILTYIFLFALSLSSFAGDDVVLFFLNDGSFKGFYKEEIDSIVYSHYDTDGIYHFNVVSQDVWSNDTVCRIPIQMIDSIRYSMPDPVYKSNVIKLDERYLPYITSADGLGLTISPDIPDYLRPKEGDVLLYEGSSELFPDGFVGKVSSFSGETLVCDSAKIEDVYERLVFMGRYVVTKDKDGDEVKYRMAGIRHRSSNRHGAISEYDFNLPLPSIENGLKVDFKTKAGTFETAYYEKTSVTLSLDINYSNSVLEPFLYSKVTAKVVNEARCKFQYSWLSIKPEEDDTFNGKTVDWLSYVVEQKDDTKSILELLVIDKAIPVPDCPVLSVGCKFGVFAEPKIEGTLSYTYKCTTTNEYTSIYNLNKSNISDGGLLTTLKNSEEPIVEHKFEGDFKASIWAGLIVGVNVGFTGDFLTENFDVKIGPYAELDANLNIKDGVADKSWYTALHDSKVKLGVKFGVKMDMKVDCLGLKTDWEQYSLEPQKLLWEKNLYLFPDFSKPTFTRNGNTLTCNSKLTRSCLPDTVGFRLYDETGKSVTQFQEQEYSVDTGEEFSITDTFTGLDFKNHRYRIIPVTKLFGKDLFTFEVPDASQTWALCKDSNHPHLIDMGLPSGTEWSCCNLLADDPLEYGGYYQWGAHYQAMSYSNSYTLPTFSGKTYQGTSNDAATTYFGADHVTPTYAQFTELLSTCNATEDESDISTWDGVFLKSNDGNDLYLPFAGCCMQHGYPLETGTGYYVLSDCSVNDGAIKCPVFKMGYDITSTCIPASYLGYSVRPVSAPEGMREVPTCTFDIGNLAMKVGETCTKTVTTNSDGKITYSSSNPDVASVDASTGKVTALKEGSTVITADVEATDTYQACSASYTVDVEGGTDEPEEEEPVEHEYVDLGLQYGTLWATCNVGAKNPEDLGGRFAWGETVPKADYSWKTYKWCDGGSYYEPNKYNYENRPYLDLEDDAANANWGGNWRMPTLVELQELFRQCTYEWTTQNGAPGMKFTGPNGNSIFFPGLEDREVDYWSNIIFIDSDSRANALCVVNDDHGLCTCGRADGLYVRPVYDSEGPRNYPYCIFDIDEYVMKVGETYTQIPTTNSDGKMKFVSTEPDIVAVDENTGKVTALKAGFAMIDVYLATTDKNYGTWDFYSITVEDEENDEIGQHNGHDYVDLGLPSGLKWATCNVGADKIEDCGSYFACGETAPKSDYSWKTYKWCEYTIYWDSYLQKEFVRDVNLTKYCTASNYGTVDNKTVLDLEDDAAHVNWGGGWYMPTESEYQELIDNCTFTWTSLHGVKGGKFTGPNGRYIFLPAAGIFWDVKDWTDGGYYLINAISDKDVSMLTIGDGTPEIWSHDRYCGYPVRPVYATEGLQEVPTCSFDIEDYTMKVGETYTKTVTTNSDGKVTYSSSNPDVATVDVTTGKVAALMEGSTVITANVSSSDKYEACSASYSVTVEENDEHEYIDLGLSVKWATCNVGASSPEDYGNYFAWGETTGYDEGKTNFDWSTYTLSNGSTSTLTKYCTDSNNGTVDNKTVLESADDAASVNWGGSWRMPTDEETDELINNCTWTWTTQNSINGYRVTGTNGNSIFLPAAGYRGSTDWGDNPLWCVGTNCYYWSSSLFHTDRDPYISYYLAFDSNGKENTYFIFREAGLPVRPVCP